MTQLIQIDLKKYIGPLHYANITNVETFDAILKKITLTGITTDLIGTKLKFSESVKLIVAECFSKF